MDVWKTTSDPSDLQLKKNRDKYVSIRITRLFETLSEISVLEFNI